MERAAMELAAMELASVLPRCPRPLAHCLSSLAALAASLPASVLMFWVKYYLRAENAMVLLHPRQTRTRRL